MANPRINRDLEENESYRHKKNLKILLILQREKDFSDDYSQKSDEAERNMKFDTYQQYHEHMLSKITFSMVETFKKNLRKDMARSFVAGSTIMDDLNLSSPRKINKVPGTSLSNLGSIDQPRRKNLKKFRLGDKQMKNLQKAFGEEKITKNDVINCLKESKHINILPYSIHSKSIIFLTVLESDLTMPLEFKHILIENVNRFTKEKHVFRKLEENAKKYYLVKVLRDIMRNYHRVIQRYHTKCRLFVEDNYDIICIERTK